MKPGALVLAALVGVSAARAQEPPPPLMSVPIDYTDVIDAFEPGDPLDVRISLGFRRTATTGHLQREQPTTSSDGVARNWVDVADTERVTNALLVGLDVGVFHDLMVFGRLPLLLSDERNLQAGGAGACAESGDLGCERLAAEPGAAESEPLFSLDPAAASPRRSGVPQVGVGAAWGVLGQHRDRYMPNWVLRAETGIGVGQGARPCLSGQTCEPGVGRGTLSLTLESRWSRRWRHVEPYLGLAHTWEWPTGADARFRPSNDVPDTDPPWIAEATVGAALIPYEDRGRWQRLAVDLRTRAAWISRGQDYTPLFDALGTSTHASLARPRTVATAGGGSADVAFGGLTLAGAHARLATDLVVTMRAAQYVSFALAFGLGYETSHLLTGQPRCNTDSTPSAGDPRTNGCTSGIVNPLYRASIDAPGARFRLDHSVTIGLGALATGTF